MYKSIISGTVIAVLILIQTSGIHPQPSENNIAQINLQEGNKFLEQNKKNKGIMVRESGLQYQILKKGKGNKPRMIDNVEVHYEGTLLNGQVFDSSIRRGKTITFPVRGVIRGWTEALMLMTEGSKWKLFIPPHLAYGERGAGSMIGPNATLIFEVELIKVK